MMRKLLAIVLVPALLRSAPQSLPDFVIDAVSLHPAIIADGRPLTATVTVRNRGATAGEGRFLDLWYNRTNAVAPAAGAVGDWWTPVGRLEAGASRVIVAPPRVVRGGGTNRLCAFVDFEDLAAELVGTNNHTCLDYPVLRGNCEFDSDGDGRVDLALFHAAKGNWHVWPGTAAASVRQFGWSATIAVPADYDGDGLTDMAVYHPAGGNWYLRESSTGQTRQVALGDSGSAPVPGDYDGDGKADPAVFRQATAVWRIAGSRRGMIELQYGWSTVIPVPADYDGDGYCDIAVYHPGTGAWHMRASATELSRTASFGWSAAVPVPADYDGDGRADIAVFHRAKADWYISYSGGGSLKLQFGWSAVLPVAADYDGDGKSDIAVYAPASGGWYIRQSSTGTTLQQTHGFSDALPVLPAPTIHRWYQLP